MYPPKRLGYKAPNCEMVFVNCTISSQPKSSHMVAVMEDGEGGVGGGGVSGEVEQGAVVYMEGGRS